MTQISLQVKEAPFHDKLEIANLIGIDVDQLDERFPIKLAYCLYSTQNKGLTSIHEILYLQLDVLEHFM